MKHLICAGLTGAALTVGCAGTAGGVGEAPKANAADASVGQDGQLAAGADGAVPCGNQVGEVLCDETFRGYVTSSTQDLATTAIFQDSIAISAALAGVPQPYAVVHLSAWWCGTCRSGVTLAVAKLNSYNSKASFMSLLVEGDTPGKPASHGNMDTWIKGLKVPFTVGADLAETPFHLRTTLGPKDTAFVIERSTRKILARVTGMGAALKYLSGLP